jgi:hypothetical protein
LNDRQTGANIDMTYDQRQSIRDSAHCLRSRLTYIMLWSRTLQLDLHDVLSWQHEAEFDKMEIALEETKFALNTLLKQFDQLAKILSTPTDDQLYIGDALPDSEHAV